MFKPGMRCCSCRVTNPREEFYRDSGDKTGLRRNCIACAKEYYAKHRSKYKRDLMLKKRYGIDQAEFNARLAAQGNACKMCGKTSPGGIGSFHVDHDHATGRVRAILCQACNMGLGQPGDDPLRAANMLAKYAVITNVA